MNLCYSVAHAGNRRSEENYSNFTGIERRSAPLSPLVAHPRVPTTRPFNDVNTHTHTRVPYALVLIVVRRVHTSYTMACDGDDDEDDAYGKRNSHLSSDVLLLGAPRREPRSIDA